MKKGVARKYVVVPQDLLPFTGWDKRKVKSRIFWHRDFGTYRKPKSIEGGKI